MGRAERRKLEKKIKHIAKTKPNEFQMLIKDEYKKFLVDMRTTKENIVPGDKVMIDVKAMIEDPDYPKLKQEYKDYVQGHANEVFTLSREMKQVGPYFLVSFEEDDSEEKKYFFTGYVKKVKENKDGDVFDSN